MTFILEDRRHTRSLEAKLTPTQRRCKEQGDTASLRVWATPTQRHGIWRMTPGVLPDVHGPETVVILSGEATVRIEPQGRDYELRAGDVFVIDAGETATWTVREAVQKFFVINTGIDPKAGE